MVAGDAIGHGRAGRAGNWFRGLIVAFLVLQAVGCGDAANCAATCDSPAIVHFDPPLTGDEFVIRVGTDVLQCSSTNCGFAADRIQAIRTATTLQSVTVMNPSSAQFRVIVEADGAVAADRTFDYAPSEAYEVCGKTCFKAVSHTYP